MIKSYQNKSNAGILLGLLLSWGTGFAIAASGWKASSQQQLQTVLPIFLGVRLLGAGLFVWGCCMYAKAKGRSAGWGAFGLLSLIGLIVLICLKDYAPNGVAPYQPGFDVLPPQYPPGQYPPQQYPPQYPPQR